MSQFDTLTPQYLDTFDEIEQKIRKLIDKKYDKTSEDDLLIFYKDFKKISEHLRYADKALVANIHNVGDLHPVLEHLGEVLMLLVSTIYLLNDKIEARDCLDIAYRQLKKDLKVLENGE